MSTLICTSALEIHAQDILQIIIVKQFFMREPALGTDSGHASAKGFHFPKNEHFIHSGFSSSYP
jgi:hypothetical protein